MKMVSNKAAWIPKPRGQLEVGDGPEAKVGAYDVLIENKAVAINPGMRFFGTACCLDG
jgi:NADPH:quinone reductase-like Zn-dependent oxidoreductase